ncbi:hypothetical protein FA592_05845 [Sulfurospirillum diekertiae]|uniref:Uncharacterized protein n=1 Tax=Sulfurospirillum diekertiae TaxID=1854492 RepID=A0A6G9VRJ5_9BACT|nr:hypothetical protein [Sulfurospirillum diekertiae]QIR75776.1 hypothetical protein FA584_05945 [Sulfurospirillum diekertiae]QIR78421.1 hypothetical protein FA592_05845 [Sulfurospirillum diekertiae]
MHILFSFLYAPIVVVLLGYFDIKTVAIGLFGFGVLWLLSQKKREIKTTIFPLFYMAVALGAYFLDDFLVLKFLPLLISLAFIFFLIASYFDNDSIILHFARKIHKRSLSVAEEAYVNRSTIFWIALASVNILLHVSILLLKNDHYWIIYSSFGWYLVFILGGIVQFLHRHFIFLKRL